MRVYRYAALLIFSFALIWSVSPRDASAALIDSQTDDSAQATRPPVELSSFKLGHFNFALGYMPSRDFNLAGVRLRINQSGGDYTCPTGGIIQFNSTVQPTARSQGSHHGDIIFASTSTPAANGSCDYITRDIWGRLKPLTLSRSKYYVLELGTGSSKDKWISMNGKPLSSATQTHFFGYRDSFTSSYVWGKSSLEAAYLELFDTPPPPPTPSDPCIAAGNCASNVLFLPGIEASRLYRPDGSGGEKKLWEPDGDATASLIALDASGASVDGSIYVKKGGIIDNAYLPIKGNIYQSFIEEMNGLVATGTVKEWKAIPYDWRLSLSEVLEKGAEIAPEKISYLTATSSPYLIQELRRLAKGSKTGKVTIIAHSNGGLLAKALTNKLGAEAAALIDKIIFVAVPQTGTPQAVGALLHGYEQALPIKPLSFAGISEATARALALNMPSVYNLLPSANYFTYTDEPVITISDDPLLAPWRTAYGGTIHSGELLNAFLTDSSRAALPVASPLVSPALGNGALLATSEVVHTALDSWAPPAGIALTEIAGWGEETLSTIHYYQGLASRCTARKTDSTCAALVTSPVLQYAPKTVLDGDGTVVVPSALFTPTAKRYWVDLKTYNKPWLTISRKHADLLEVPQLRTFIKNIISNTSISLPQFISTTTPIDTDTSRTRLHFTLHSPLSLNLYDEFGNHTGISTSTNSLEEDIPGSRYLSFGEVQYVSTPASANLRLVMDGYAEGSFTLDLAEVEGGITLASTTFAGVPSSSETVAMIDISTGEIAGASPLTVDENGDGRVDLTLVPKVGGIVLPRMPATVAAQDAKMVLGDALPPLSYAVSDALGSAVAEGDLSGTPDCTTEATSASSVGSYPIICSFGTLASEKYEFTTFTPGTLTVEYRWDGFLPPVANKHNFKAGSTIPVKFQLKKVDGTPVKAARALEWLDPLSGAVSAVYRWDDAAEQYIYNWSTKRLAAGAYRISVKLDDGTTRYITIYLK